VVNKLFSQKVSPAIALKWKQQEDLTSYQSQSVSKEIQSQTYQKDDSVNHVECDELTMLSEENRVLTTQVPKESSCTGKRNKESIRSGLVNKLIDSDCDQVNLKAKNNEQKKQKGLCYLQRELDLYLRNVRMIFYGRLATLHFQ
jgi:hypothetical protein